MKISLPENISEITLGQYQRYLLLIKKDLDAYTFINEKICIFTSIDKKTIEQVSRKDIEEMNAQIDKALNEDAKFNNRFTINNIEFGFVNLSKITQGEYIDLIEYSKDIEQGTNLNKFISVLFRPIINNGSNYTIADYTANDEYFDYMKQTPMSIVNGTLGFFLDLRNDLQNHIQKYTTAEAVREM